MTFNSLHLPHAQWPPRISTQRHQLPLEAEFKNGSCALVTKPPLQLFSELYLPLHHSCYYMSSTSSVLSTSSMSFILYLCNLHQVSLHVQNFCAITYSSLVEFIIWPSALNVVDRSADITHDIAVMETTLHEA